VTTKSSPGTLTRPAGVEIAYEVSGSRGPVILLTHGFTVTLRMWDPTVAALVQAGWRVVTWDVRGHGLTATPEEPSLYSLDRVIDDLAALLDHLELDQVVMGGLSFGGYLSLAFWVAHRDRVQALVLADTGPGYRNADAREAWNQAAVERAADIDARGVTALESSGAAGSNAAVQGQVGFDRHRSLAGLSLAVRGFLTQHDGRVMEALPKIRVPTLILVGEQDEPFRKASDVMTAKIEGAEQVVIPDAGHVANLDQPEAFNQALLGFLKRFR
jgi:pimeloyl-ACP methyl ester carboxylesterase